MRIKIVFSLLTSVLLTAAPLAEAQQPAKMFRIGVLTGSSLSSQSERNEAFRQGLRELGYVEGKDILIDWHSYEGNRERQRKLVDELVRLKVDVIVAVGSGDIQTAKEATSTIPIVMMVGGDPVASGFITSLARPGGNILPAIYTSTSWVDSGGLMSYGPDRNAMYRRAAYYVDKILKGAKPADLPVEQAAKFDLAMNLKAAKQIGLTIPQSLLFRADRVIK